MQLGYNMGGAEKPAGPWSSPPRSWAAPLRRPCHPPSWTLAAYMSARDGSVSHSQGLKLKDESKLSCLPAPSIGRSGSRCSAGLRAAAEGMKPWMKRQTPRGSQAKLLLLLEERKRKKLYLAALLTDEEIARHVLRPSPAVQRRRGGGGAKRQDASSGTRRRGCRGEVGVHGGAKAHQQRHVCVCQWERETVSGLKWRSRSSLGVDCGQNCTGEGACRLVVYYGFLRLNFTSQLH